MNLPRLVTRRATLWDSVWKTGAPFAESTKVLLRGSEEEKARFKAIIEFFSSGRSGCT